jgi:hypothetical protein
MVANADLLYRTLALRFDPAVRLLPGQRCDGVYV